MARMETKEGEKLEAKIITVNPAVAKELLRTARGNRSKVRARIRRYASAMSRGDFRVAQPLLKDNEGRLIDGQHRLNAVIMAHAEVDFLVITGFDYDNVFCKLDDVTPRPLRVWLEIQGTKHPKITAAVIAMAARDRGGLIPTGHGAAFSQTQQEGVDFLVENPEISDSVVAAGVVNRFVPWAMSAFAHWKFMQFDEALASAFFIDLTMDQGGVEDDPIYLLRERMKSDKRAKVKMHYTDKLALVYKAFNHCRRGDRPHILRWRTQGPNAEAFPEVI